MFGVPSNAKKTSPYFDIALPLEAVDIDAARADRSFSAQLDLETTDLIIAGASVYEDQTGIGIRSLEILVLTPEESAEYEEIRRAYLARKMPLAVLPWLAISGTAVLLGVALSKRIRSKS